MPYIQINGASLFYEEAGTGSETILFIHGLMLASESWEAQRDFFTENYHVVTFDLRGQGRSDHTHDRLDLDSLAEDAAEFIQALTLGPCHIVGFSMGAFIAMRIAARKPRLVRSLVLIGPSAEAEEPGNWPRYALMIAIVSIFGPRPLTTQLMQILFGDTFLADENRHDERRHWAAVVKALPRSLVRAASASAKRKSIVGELRDISAPTLVISGSEDRPVNPKQASVVANGIKNAKFVSVAQTGHAVMIEQPEHCNALLNDWFPSVQKDLS